MAYRKITVNEQVYEYIIGSSHIKIKNFGLFKVADVGNFIIGSNKKYLVTPATVARIIKGEPVPAAHHCREHGVTTDDVVADPYHQAVTGKIRYIPYCPECYKEQRLSA